MLGFSSILGLYWRYNDWRYIYIWDALYLQLCNDHPRCLFQCGLHICVLPVLLGFSKNCKKILGSGDEIKHFCIYI